MIPDKYPVDQKKIRAHYVPMKLPLFPETPRPLLFAHRGCSELCPENTMPAFRMAAEKNIQGIELDIQLSADGGIVVFHDRDLSRICGIGRNVSDLTVRELATADAGIWKGEDFKETGIPLLKEVLTELADTMLFDIEIKYYNAAAALPLVKGLAGLINELNIPAGRLCLSSFDPRIIYRVKKVIPTIPAGLIYEASSLPLGLGKSGAGVSLIAALCGADFLKPRADLAGQTMRLPRLCWTVDDHNTALACLNQGAEGIISNRPEELIASPGLYPV